LKIACKQRPTKKSESEDIPHSLARQKKSEEINYKPTITNPNPNPNSDLHQQHSDSEHSDSRKVESSARNHNSREQHYIIKEPQ